MIKYFTLDYAEIVYHADMLVDVALNYYRIVVQKSNELNIFALQRWTSRILV